MQQTTNTLKQLFDLVSEKEGHTFELDSFYTPKCTIAVQSPDGGLKNVNRMVVKKDRLCTMTMGDGTELEMAYNHVISTDIANKKFAYVKSLKVGDQLPTQSGAKATIAEIATSADEQLVYDIGVDCDPDNYDEAVYFDSHGFLHHNTHDVTTQVTKYLGKNVDEAGADGNSKWHIIKGFSTPAGLYGTIFENRHRLLVFDDCDSILKDANARNILKAALDSYDSRMISWISKKAFNPEGMSDEAIQAEYEATGKLPSRFEFTGQVIFISNMHKSQIEEAILSRSLAIDITLRASDVFLRIESILDKLCPSVSLEMKKEALEHLKDNHQKLSKPANLRTMIAAAKIRAGGSPNWKRLVERYS